MTPAAKVAEAKFDMECIKAALAIAADPGDRARLEQDLHRARVTLKFAQHRMRWAAWKAHQHRIAEEGPPTRRGQ